jgi:leader peptidase (prepilin peptidase)/N-methyltransferase
MIALIAGLFGLIIGSFLNVVILRRGVKGIGGRSACAQCGHALAWYDLIPVISWVSLRGRCRYCGSHISMQYPLVEAVTAALFATIVASPFPVGAPYTMTFCVIAALLVCICTYDLRHTIIPDAWVYAFDALAFCTMPWLFAAMTPPDVPVWPLFAAGFIAAFPLFFLWAISRGTWMGFGDVKLALGIGWLLGPWSGVFAIFFAFIIGSVVLVPMMVYERVTHTRTYGEVPAGLTMKSEVPFGPFLVASTLIVWLCLLYGIDLAALADW